MTPAAEPDAFLESWPADLQEIIRRLRTQIVKTAPNPVEVMIPEDNTIRFGHREA